jgi:hypothetical protein
MELDDQEHLAHQQRPACRLPTNQNPLSNSRTNQNPLSNSRTNQNPLSNGLTNQNPASDDLLPGSPAATEGGANNRKRRGIFSRVFSKTYLPENSIVHKRCESYPAI